MRVLNPESVLMGLETSCLPTEPAHLQGGGVAVHWLAPLPAHTLSSPNQSDHTAHMPADAFGRAPGRTQPVGCLSSHPPASQVPPVQVFKGSSGHTCFLQRREAKSHSWKLGERRKGGLQMGELKWALKSITTNKASGGDGIPVELFQILKDDADRKSVV